MIEAVLDNVGVGACAATRRRAADIGPVAEDQREANVASAIEIEADKRRQSGWWVPT